MRLPEYDYGQYGIYFITMCSKDKAKIFSNIVGGDALIAPQVHLTSVGSIIDKYIGHIPGIDKYVIMPNHIHMLIKIEIHTPDSQNISQIVKSLKTVVTKDVGRSMVQRSFYDHIIRGEEDYFNICKYIDENPAKWRTDELFVK